MPDGVAVIGFDDSTSALMCRPALTTVRQPIETMAAEMARLLLERLDVPDMRPRAAISGYVSMLDTTPRVPSMSHRTAAGSVRIGSSCESRRRLLTAVAA